MGRDELILAWGAEWAVDRVDGRWRAFRLDCRGELLTAATTRELDALIRETRS